MRKRLTGLILLACLVAAPIAQSYDRTPLRTSGLERDKWGYTIGDGEKVVQARYFPRASSVYCTGVIVSEVGAAGSTWMHGPYRVWDKLACQPSCNGARLRRSCWMRARAEPSCCVSRTRPVSRIRLHQRLRRDGLHPTATPTIPARACPTCLMTSTAQTLTARSM